MGEPVKVPPHTFGDPSNPRLYNRHERRKMAKLRRLNGGKKKQRTKAQKKKR